MAGHTPGPWAVEQYDANWKLAHGARYVCIFGQAAEIARCGFNGCASVGAGLAVATANARLIAAAPDLLAACEAAKDALRALADKAGDVAEWNRGGYAYEAAKRLRGAVAKAKGE